MKKNLLIACLIISTAVLSACEKVKVDYSSNAVAPTISWAVRNLNTKELKTYNGDTVIAASKNDEFTVVVHSTSISGVRDVATEWSFKYQCSGKTTASVEKLQPSTMVSQKMDANGEVDADLFMTVLGGQINFTSYPLVSAKNSKNLDCPMNGVYEGGELVITAIAHTFGTQPKVTVQTLKFTVPK